MMRYETEKGVAEKKAAAEAPAPAPPRKGNRGNYSHGGTDPSGAVRVPESALLPGDGRR